MLKYSDIKRILDFILSLILLLLVSPMLVIFALFIKMESRGTIFYTQKRLGMNGRVFKLFKLRSMNSKTGSKHQPNFNVNQEVTKVGKVIRRLKIDELPQLINIIKGEMSFIGPRPCLPELMEKFDQNGQYRLKVKPGLSGLAQVNGNIYLSWPERWVYDREYVINMSFKLDVCIFFKTLIIIIYGEDKFVKNTLK